MPESELQTMVDAEIKSTSDKLDEISEDIIRTIQLVSYRALLTYLVNEAGLFRQDMEDDIDSCEALEAGGLTQEAFLLYGKAMETRGKILQSRHVAQVLQEWIREVRMAELDDAIAQAKDLIKIRDEALGIVINESN